MQQFLGRAVSPGYAAGTAYIYNKCQMREIPHYEIASADIPAEHRRFHEALELSLRELKQLEERVLVELGEAQSAIFAAHLGLLQDQSFSERIKTRIERDLVNVEHALNEEMADLCQMLASVESEYIRERAQDIRDVGMRLLRQLDSRDGGRYLHLPPQSVIVAHELLPSETLDLDREHVVAIVTEAGGENSHAAILARALGIPAVTGIAAATSHIPAGGQVLVDGQRGVVSVMPSQEAMASFVTKKSHYDHDTSNPSVLRAIAKVVDAGRSAGRDVTVCGEAASYPRTACLLVGLGVRRISMSPLRAARVRYQLRKMHMGALEELAEKALKCKSVTEVRKLLEN